MSHSSDIEVPTKDFIRKIRPAFAGVPDDSPFDKHLLIWSNNNVLQAAFVSDVPDALSYDGSTYHLQQPYIGDWDALISAAKHLVGFLIILSGDEPIIASDFLRRHKQIKFTEGMLEIILCPDSDYSDQCVQGIGTRLFVDSRGDYIFLFPQWCEWGNIEFSLCTIGIPTLILKADTSVPS